MANSSAEITSSDEIPTETSPKYDDDNEVSAYAQQIAIMISFPMAMQTSIDLDLFEIIARAQLESGHPITAAEIAEQLSASNKEKAADMLDRLLRMLASFGVVTCSVDVDGRRAYGMSPVGRYFVRNEDNASFAPWTCLAHEKASLEGWAMLKEAILGEGIPFNRAHGMNIFEYSRLDMRFNKVFNLAMLNHTNIVMQRFLQRYKGFENIKQLVDVAGGLGHTLKLIVSKYPTIKGINFDLPHVIEHAISFPGIHHISGDMFESVPGPSEAIFLKWVIHDWSDEDCVKLLRRCYNALLDDGKVIILDHLLADEPDTTTTSKAISMLDVIMMTNCPGGRERTRKEFIALATAAGFTTTKFVCHACNYWIMEIFKY